MPEIVDLFAMVSRMHVLDMPRSVACADNVVCSIIETYFTPNRTVADLREPHAEQGGHRSLDGLQRSGAPGAERVRNALN
jgi:hypothetical protein